MNRIADRVVFPWAPKGTVDSHVTELALPSHRLPSSHQAIDELVVRSVNLR